MHALPVEAVALAAAFERPVPVSGRLVAERVDRVAVARHAVVVAVPADDAGEPASLVGDWVVLASAQLGLDLAELGPHPLLADEAPEHEPSGAFVDTRVREAEELERLGLAEPARLSISGGESPELSISRVFSGCRSRPNFANLSRRSARNRSASSRFWKPPMAVGRYRRGGQGRNAHFAGRPDGRTWDLPVLAHRGSVRARDLQPRGVRPQLADSAVRGVAFRPP